MQYTFDGPDDTEAVDMSGVTVTAGDYTQEFGNVECDDQCDFHWRETHDPSCVLYSEEDYKKELQADRDCAEARLRSE